MLPDAFRTPERLLKPSCLLINVSGMGVGVMSEESSHGLEV